MTDTTTIRCTLRFPYGDGLHAFPAEVQVSRVPCAGEQLVLTIGVAPGMGMTPYSFEVKYVAHTAGGGALIEADYRSIGDAPPKQEALETLLRMIEDGISRPGWRPDVDSGFQDAIRAELRALDG